MIEEVVYMALLHTFIRYRWILCVHLPVLKLQAKLHFTDSATRLIAKKAIARNTGARGLRAILEDILTEAMFEVFKS